MGTHLIKAPLRSASNDICFCGGKKNIYLIPTLKTFAGSDVQKRWEAPGIIFYTGSGLRASTLNNAEKLEFYYFIDSGGQTHYAALMFKLDHA